MRKVPRRLLSVAVIAALMCTIIPLTRFTPTADAANPTELFFSEYIEGSSFNKAVEIYNGTGAPINLATGAYKLEMYFNGSTTAGFTLNLSGTVPNNGTWVVAPTNANATILGLANQTSGTAWFNGDDAVVLRKGTTIIDVIGQIGFDPGTEWGTGVVSTADNTIRRKPTFCAGDTNESNVFDPSVEWDGFAQDTFSGLGSHTTFCNETPPAVTSTSPTSGASNVDVESNITITFNEPVAVTDPWFTISCNMSGSHTAAVTGGPLSFTLNPNTDFSYNESCTVTVLASQVADVDPDDPPNNPTANHVFSFSTPAVNPCDATFMPIPQIQGDDDATTVVGSVTTRGVVTGDFQGSTKLSGFFLQDAAGDGNTATSDGIFIFVPNANPLSAVDVAVGDVVVVTGEPKEFNTMTEMDFVTTIKKCGAGSVAPTIVDLPETVNGELEQYEGMLVTIPEALTVSQNFFLGRFGQVTLSSDGRLFNPNNSNAPNSPGALAEKDSNARRLLVLDDGTTAQNPNPVPYIFGADNTLRAGDTVAGLTGVVDFGPISSNTAVRDYRVHPTVAPVFSRENPRPAAPESVGGNVKVATFNLLNYFNGNGTGLDSGPGGFPTSRGADNLNEFNRQRTKTIAAITGINPDVLGVIEVENDGGGPTSAIQDLVNGLNAATSPGTYAFRVGTTPGTDEIQNAIIYKPARVTPVGAAVNDVDNVGDNAWAQARNPLAQTFQYINGEKFTFIVNHFTSKGCSANDTGPDADQGDGQGCDNFQRTEQAQRLLVFIAERQAASGDQDVLVMGDLNAYGLEDPINILTGGGLVNEIENHVAPPRYSFVFDGQAGYLDHALSTMSLSPQVTGVTEWHINADEPVVLDYDTDFNPPGLYTPTPYRSADHDPIIVGLELNATPVVGAITATPDPVIVNGTVNTSANFTDGDTDDTHTALWNWGDTTSSAGVVSETNGSGSVTGSHIYSAVGSYTITLTVTDDNGNAGSNTEGVDVTYGILPLFDQTKAAKSGSTIPIKLQLVDANGNNLSGSDKAVHVVAVKLNSVAVAGTDYDSGNANPDNDFRFDSTLGGYVFNLSTKNLNLGTGEYTLCFTVTGDPVIHEVTFKVK